MSAERRPARTLLVVCDSDSYLKWGAALAARMPEPWSARIALLETPVAPSARQLDVALAGTGFSAGDVVRAELDVLSALAEGVGADAVLLALRGPLVRVVVPEIARAQPRPVLLSGFPGLTIPAEPKAIVYREQCDMILLHSRREVREFQRNAAVLEVGMRFGLATLPFLDADGGSARALPGTPGDIVFAVQAKVPAGFEQRARLVRMLADAARARPDRRVVVKVRARRGEAQTHAEAHDLALMIEAARSGLGDAARWIGSVPHNLVVEDGPMSDHLDRAAALVTVSSTAALEAIGRGIPVLLLDDFGVGHRQINTVFEGSGLFGDAGDLAAGRFRHPALDWLADNYFHGTDADDWLAALDGLVERHEASPLPLRPRLHNLTGGALRRAFERRRMLGEHDRSLSGSVAMAVAVPARWALRRARRIGRALAARPGGPATDG